MRVLRVPRKIFGPMREDVTGGWRRLHNEEFHNLYDSPDMIRVIKSSDCQINHFDTFHDTRKPLFPSENSVLRKVRYYNYTSYMRCTVC
jgi:hypothetical protein